MVHGLNVSAKSLSAQRVASATCFYVVVGGPGSGCGVGEGVGVGGLLLVSVVLVAILTVTTYRSSNSRPFAPRRPRLSKPSNKRSRGRSRIPSMSSLRMGVVIDGHAVATAVRSGTTARSFLTHLPLRIALGSCGGAARGVFCPSPTLTVRNIAHNYTPVTNSVAVCTP